MFCKSASQLLKELAYHENDQLTLFNNDMFEQVFRECDEHHMHLQSLMRKIQDDGLDMQTTRNSDHFGSVQPSRNNTKPEMEDWDYTSEEVQSKLNYSEEEYFKNHCAALEGYMSEIDLDLTVDMIPPKDPSLQVRVLCDIGDVLLGDQVASLTKNSVHLMKRTDAEQFISQGMMEEFT